MRIWCLRPETVAPVTPQQRSHHPSGRYETFRACIRWDFEFTCAFCLTHEGSLAPPGPGGTEGMGLLSIEHVSPQSADEEAAHRYRNCVYACMRCNNVRRATPVHDGRRTLLDPTATAWAAHFDVVRDDAKETVRLAPRQGDANAGHTETVYDLNDELKMTRRYWRAKRVEALLHEVEQGARNLVRLESLASGQSSLDVAALAAEFVEKTRRAMRDALEELDKQWRIVPVDADRPCACAVRQEAMTAAMKAKAVLVEYRNGDVAGATVDRSPS